MATMTRIGPIEIGANAVIPQNGDATFSTVGVLFNSYEGLTTDATGGAYIAWNLSNLNAEMDFVCDHGVGGGGGFAWYNSPADTLVDHTQIPLMTLDEFGVLTLTRGGMEIGANASISNEGDASFSTVAVLFNSYEGLTTDATGGAYIAWNLSNLNAEMDFVCDHGVGGGGGFNWYNSAADTLVDHTKIPLMTLDEFGVLTLERGGINVRGDASFRTVAVLFNSYEGLTTDATGGAYIAWNLSNLNAEMDFVCDHGVGGGGGFNWYNSAADTLVDHTKIPLMTLDEFGVLTLTSGGVVLPADPTQPLEAATKQYVDNHSGGGGGGNMVYPAAGVPQSTGSAWAASIVANTLARRDQANTFALAQTFQGTVTLAADPATNLQAATKQYVDDHTSMVYPAAGIPQSTGAAWGTSIVASTLAYRNQANTFTAAQSFNSTVTLSGDPSSNLQAATKQYVDNHAGGSMVYPPAGIAVSTGVAWGGSIDPAILGEVATWPAAGVPVSNGSAWSATIDPATLPRLNAANTFAGAPSGYQLHITDSATNPHQQVMVETVADYALVWYKGPGYTWQSGTEAASGKWYLYCDPGGNRFRDIPQWGR